jgi:hypothetical protein
MNQELINIIIDYLQSQGYECNSSQSDWEKLFNNPEIFGKNWNRLVENEVGTSLENFLQYQLKYNSGVKGIVSNYQYIPTLDEQKEYKINEFKGIANSELSKTDYKIIRQYEYNTLPEIEFEALKAERQAIRDKCNLLEEQVLECDNYESLININWQYE